MVGETMQKADAKFCGFDILGILINYETITNKKERPGGRESLPGGAQPFTFIFKYKDITLRLIWQPPNRRTFPYMKGGFCYV